MHEELEHATDALIESYTNEPTKIHHLGLQPLPSHAEIIRALVALHELIFPGYIGMQGLTAVGDLRDHVAGRIGWLHATLTEQIRRAITHKQKLDATCTEIVKEEAGARVIEFLSRLPALRHTLASDVQAAYTGDPAAESLDEIIFSYPGLYAVMVYRVAHEFHKMGVPLLPRIMSEHAHQRTGIDIHPGTEIGPSFFIDHGTGVVIGGTAVIGSNVRLYQGVTLGAFAFAKDENGQLIRNTKRHPTIEDDVIIYAGATILGGNTVIGRGSVIGGNVWLTHSIPPGTRVLQEKSKLRIITAKEAAS
jgi:serine O-acetyltransferase